MILLNSNIKKGLRSAKNTALALGLGIASLLPISANASEKIKHSGTGIGYSSKVAELTSEELIKSITTPKEFIFYRDNTFSYTSDQEAYGKGDYWASFSEMHEKARERKKENGKYVWKDDCDGVAFAAAACLADNGYAPQIAWVRKKNSGVSKMFASWRGDTERANKEYSAHGIFPYQDKETGKWGCVGVGRSEDRDPKYETIEDLVSSLKTIYEKKGYELDYKTHSQPLENLDASYGNRDAWTNADDNLANTYDATAYSFVRDEMRKSGKIIGAEDTVSRDAIISKMVENNICSPRVAKREFDRAYRQTKADSEIYRQMSNGYVKNEKPGAGAK